MGNGRGPPDELDGRELLELGEGWVRFGALARSRFGASARSREPDELVRRRRLAWTLFLPESFSDMALSFGVVLCCGSLVSCQA